MSVMGKVLQGDCTGEKVQAYDATDCDGTEMTDEELSAWVGNTRSEFEAMIKFHDCDQDDCDFISVGTNNEVGRTCVAAEAAGMKYEPKVLNQCLKTNRVGIAASEKYLNCANGVANVEYFSGSTDCSGSSVTNTSTEVGMCVKCEVSDVDGVVISGGDGGSPAASSSMPRFKGLVSAGLLAMVTVALAMM